MDGMDDRREEILKVFPDAVYMPWDELAYGQRVFIRPDFDGRRRTGIVIKRYENYHPPLHRCPTCSCPDEPDAANGWWIIRLDVPFPSMSLDDLLYDVIEYPPTLTPWT